MINLVSRLKVQYRPGKIYVDGAKPDFIKSLKSMFNEPIDYKIIYALEKIKSIMKQECLLYRFHLEYRMELLGRFQQFVSKGWFSISLVEYKELVTQMRIVRFKESGNEVDL